MQKLSSAVAMILFTASPAMATDQSVPFPSRESVSIKVSTDDLDLHSAQDRERLRNRMNRAITAACNRRDNVYSVYDAPDRQCYQEMAQNADAKLQAFARNDVTGTVANDIAKN